MEKGNKSNNTTNKKEQTSSTNSNNKANSNKPLSKAKPDPTLKSVQTKTPKADNSNKSIQQDKKSSTPKSTPVPKKVVSTKPNLKKSTSASPVKEPQKSNSPAPKQLDKAKTIKQPANLKTTTPKVTPSPKSTSPANNSKPTPKTTPAPVQKAKAATSQNSPLVQKATDAQKQKKTANRIVSSAQNQLETATNNTVKAGKEAQNKMGSLAAKGDQALQSIKSKTTNATISKPETNLFDSAPKYKFPDKLEPIVDPKLSKKPKEGSLNTQTTPASKTPVSKTNQVQKQKPVSTEQTQLSNSKTLKPVRPASTKATASITTSKDSLTPTTSTKPKAEKATTATPAVGLTPDKPLQKVESTPKSKDTQATAPSSEKKPVLSTSASTIKKSESTPTKLTKLESKSTPPVTEEQTEQKTENNNTENNTPIILAPFEAMGQSLLSLFSKPEKKEKPEDNYWTAPITQKKDETPKRKAGLKDLFLFSSGVDRDILQHCPADESRFIGVGGTVIFTGLLAFLSSSYAIYTVFDNWLMALFFGMIWGFMIYNLDRYIVSSMKNHGSWWKDLTIAFPRLIMAVLLALVISKPLELKIFEKEINSELITMEQEIFQDQENQVKERYEAEIEKYETTATEMETTLSGLRAKRDTLEMMALREADGSGGSGKKNMGPIYQAKRKDADQAQEEYETEKARLMPKIDFNKEKATELKADMEEEMATLDQQSYSGMAARMEALHRLGEESQAIWWASFMIMLLFVIVEVSPVLVKLISSKTAYDYLSMHKEHAIKMATQEEIEEANKQLQNRIKFDTETNVYRTQALIQLEKEMIDNYVRQQRDQLKKGNARGLRTASKAKAS